MKLAITHAAILFSPANEGAGAAASETKPADAAQAGDKSKAAETAQTTDAGNEAAASEAETKTAKQTKPAAKGKAQAPKPAKPSEQKATKSSEPNEPDDDEVEEHEFEVASPVRRNGKTYAIGKPIKLDKTTHSQLHRAGAVTGEWPGE